MIFLGILMFTLIQLYSCELGDSCGDLANGKCVLIPDCKPATDALKKRKHHNLERCGFQGLEEIVCCPDNEDWVKNPEKMRKSVVACNSFKNDELGIFPYIIGGINASLEEFPHMAALGYQDETRNEYNFECGGSLISESYVLTAAHCLVRADNKTPAIIRMGKVDLLGMEDGTEPQDILVAEIYPHKEYAWQDRINDIGLVRLTRSVEVNKNVKPICLYTENSDPPKLLIAGWGKIGNTREGSRFLLKAELSPVNLSECNITLVTRTFGKPIFKTQLCARSNDSVVRDTCQGDSGGPIQTEETKSDKVARLVGVTSFGQTCGGSLPGIYTRVSEYLDWIENIVWP